MTRDGIDAPDSGAALQPGSHLWRLRYWALGVFALTLVWNGVLASLSRPVGRSEEHLDIGRRLHSTGTLTGEDDPGVLRPPGYPVFVAGVLYLLDAASAAGGDPLDDEAFIQFIQCVLLSGIAGTIFFFGASRVAPLESACVGVAFGCSPVALALAGTLSYPLLHMAGTLVSTVLLAAAADQAQRRLAFLWAGVAFGLTTLVRPLTLLLPPFVLLLALMRRGSRWRSAVTGVLVFTAGMAAVILPYGVRNYLVTGYVVPVNVQGGFAVWASTVRHIGPDEDFLDWNRMWDKHGLAIYRRVTGEPTYTLATFNRHIFELNEAFAARAWKNIRRRPSLYAHNVFHNLWRFTRDPLVYWPFQLVKRNQIQPRPLPLTWVVVHTSGVALLGLPGLLLGLRRRDPAAWAIALVFVLFAAAHALTFLNGRYTYVKLPLLMMAVVLTLSTIGDRALPLRRSGGPLRLAAVMAVVLALSSVLVTAKLLNFSWPWA